MVLDYLKGINEKTTSFIQIAKREQGLIVNRSNPKKIYSIKDLTRKDIRFINRQPSSGTYFLLECLLNKNKIRSEEINGFQQGEYTHAAVAAFVASGMADVGLGLETPARNFDLDFIPIASERYFVAFNKETLNKNKLQKLISIIEDKEFEKTINIGRNIAKENVISVIWHDNVLKMKGGRMYEKILEFLTSQDDVKILPGKELVKILE